MANSRQRDYRNHYRTQHIGQYYSGPAHLAALIVIAGSIIAYCLIRLESVTPLEWLTVPLTFLYANLVEYLAHRFPMHHSIRGLGIIFRRHTLQHHRFFANDRMEFDDRRDYKAVLFPLPIIVFFAVFFMLPLGTVLSWLATDNVGLLFVAVSVAYYLNYELLHFAYHSSAKSWVRRIPGMSRLCRLHTTHHDPALMLRYNFNITYPICDLVFGTYHRDRDAMHNAESLSRRGM